MKTEDRTNIAVKGQKLFTNMTLSDPNVAAARNMRRA